MFGTQDICQEPKSITFSCGSQFRRVQKLILGQVVAIFSVIVKNGGSRMLSGYRYLNHCDRCRIQGLGTDGLSRRAVDVRP